MKLTVKRSQSQAETGLFSKSITVSFSLFCKLLLTQEEKSLITKYGLTQRRMTSAFDYSDNVRTTFNNLDLHISDLEQGVSYTDTGGPGYLLSVEEMIIEKCKDLKAIINTHANYNKDREIDI